MGMHFDIPDHQLRDRDAREHRIRIWWTAYILDRTCASKVGMPVTIQDDIILVSLPSDEDLENREDFGIAEYTLQSIALARLAAGSIRSIYSRRKHDKSFSQRVQSALKDLTKWMGSLSLELQLGEKGTTIKLPDRVIFLHLRFNQACYPHRQPVPHC